MKLYTKTCVICNTEFSYKQYPSVEKANNRLTCSKACMYKLTSEKLSGKFIPNKYNEKDFSKWTISKCAYCGSDIKHLKSWKRKFCSTKCKGSWQSENLSGKNNPNWKPHSEKKLYTSQNKKVRKDLIEERVVCEKCGTNKNLQVNHIDKNYNNNSFNNLMLLCVECHARWHEERGDFMVAKLIRSHYQNTGKREERNDIICLVCGNKFHPENNKRRFCSKKCSSLYRYPNQHKIIYCKACGIAFERKKTKQTYCSVKCSNSRFEEK